MKNIILKCTIESAKDIEKLKALVSSTSASTNQFMLMLPTNELPNECVLRLKGGADISPQDIYQTVASNARGRFGITSMTCVAANNDSLEENASAIELTNQFIRFAQVLDEHKQVIQAIREISSELDPLKKQRSELNTTISNLNELPDSEKGEHGHEYITSLNKDSLNYVNQIRGLDSKKNDLMSKKEGLERQITELNDVLKFAPTPIVQEAPVSVAPKQNKSIFSSVYNAFRGKAPREDSVRDKQLNDLMKTADVSEKDKKQKGAQLEGLLGELKLKASQRASLDTLDTVAESVSDSSSDEVTLSPPPKPVLFRERGMRGNDFNEMVLHVGVKESLEELAAKPEYKNTYVLKDDVLGKKVLAMITATGDIVQSSVAKNVKVTMLMNKINQLAEAQNQSGDTYALKLSKKDLDMLKEYTEKPKVFAGNDTNAFKSRVPKDELGAEVVETNRLDK